MKPEKMKNIRKYGFWALVILLAITCCAIGTVGWYLHWRWGDVPTWIVAVATTFALVAATLAARSAYEQLGALKEQTEALKSQADTRTRLLRIQKAQARADREASRHLAEQDIKLRMAEHLKWAQRATMTPVARTAQLSGTLQEVLGATVTNRHTRPIRNVRCMVDVDGGTLANWAVMEPEPAVGGYPKPVVVPVRFMPSNRQVAFSFPTSARQRQLVRYWLRFTDDDGFHWELDDEINVRTPENPDEW